MNRTRPHNARLEACDYAHIRQWHALGYSQASIARAYGVSSGYVSHVINGTGGIKSETPPLLSDYDKRRIHHLRENRFYTLEELAERFSVPIAEIKRALAVPPPPRVKEVRG